ncbi:zinc ABC transporter substrate-binding protein [Pseudonocardia yunnanensis]|uniref:Metal ABC transporter solute-binding protein, Zn/Mn family n=1 Tax=Pseudonocardia yunnanensis TaxID=58107 RepID=A0ABW4ES53_9PSEU
MLFRRSGALATLAVLAALALAGCGSGSAPAPPPPAAPHGNPPIKVVTSTNVYGSIARAVGGDQVDVTSLINDPQADPHSYETTPGDAAKVATANVILYNGGGYDDFMERLVQSSGGKAVSIDVTALSGLDPTAGAGGADAASNPYFNEHLWYSLPTVQKVADQLATDFGAADPADADLFTTNAQAFKDKVANLLTKEQAIGAAHPGARVAVTEPVPGYLIQSAGLTDVTPPEFARAIEEDTDPPAAVLQQTLALFTNNPVSALILNAQTETPTTTQVEQAAQAAKIPVVMVTETLPAGVDDYITWMNSEIEALANALNGSPQ